MAGVASRAIKLKQRVTRKGQAAILHFLCPGRCFFWLRQGERRVCWSGDDKQSSALAEFDPDMVFMFSIAISIVEPAEP